MDQEIVQVDSFTDRPFGGNPAAVCLLGGPADEGWMQAVAGEMNLSETAFLHPEGDGYRLRWFTPLVEVDLCGHATLAAAHVLWEGGHLPIGDRATFQTRSGTLLAMKSGSWITLDFPAKVAERAVDPGPVAKALGVPVVAAWANQFDVLAEVESEAVVRGLSPDYGLVQAIPARGLIATARAETPGFDFVSRFFAPQCGVPEDPVTGSAHCFLGPYWGEKLGKAEMIGSQVSRRGGVVRVALVEGRVLLGGQAVTTLRGSILGEPARP